MRCFIRNGITWIRVQTNSFPDHCFDAAVTPQENVIQFEVPWNRDPNSYPPLDLDTANKYDSQVCNWNKPYSNPAYSFINLSGDKLQGVSGIAITGVPIFPGLDEGGKDAYYPHPDAPGFDPSELDECLGWVSHPSPFYHYIGHSPCILGTKPSTVRLCSEAGVTCPDIKTGSGFDDPEALTVAGIALDGHRLFGPYKASGTLFNSCELDICNGIIAGGNYGYAQTHFFSYTTACWGPGIPFP